MAVITLLNQKGDVGKSTTTFHLGGALAKAGRRVLIIDNDRSVGTSLTFMLSARGYEEVRSVRSPQRAVSLAQLYHPALVFLDYDLPDPGALDVADRLRKGAQQHAMRLIALTTNSEHEFREEARAAGFERYLMKPLSQNELDKILRIPGSPPI